MFVRLLEKNQLFSFLGRTVLATGLAIAPLWFFLTISVVCTPYRITTYTFADPSPSPDSLETVWQHVIFSNQLSDKLADEPLHELDVHTHASWLQMGLPMNLLANLLGMNLIVVHAVAHGIIELPPQVAIVMVPETVLGDQIEVAPPLHPPRFFTA